MISIELADVYFIYLVVGIGSMLSLWWYYDFRDKNLYQAERSKTVFHCVKCGKIYSDKMDVKQSNCPRCKFINTHLQY